MENNVTNGPQPSKHVFLSQLREEQTGTKVRFLCCVRFYDVESGCLFVEHAYPRAANPIPTAIVSVTNMQESLKSSMVAPGSWLNVIGYVQDKEIERESRKRKRNRSTSTARVQAVLVWDATSIKLGEYEEALELIIADRK